MNQLLDAYLTCNSLANAKRLRAYVLRHPMVMCMLTVDHEHIVNQAIALADREG